MAVHVPPERVRMGTITDSRYVFHTLLNLLPLGESTFIKMISVVCRADSSTHDSLFYILEYRNQAALITK